MILLLALLLFAPNLFEQSVVRVWTRDFPEAEFVLVDVQSRQVLGRKWTSTAPVPVGSLVKPFVALGWPADRSRVRCNPRDCWLASGHGEVDLVSAIARSCNSYFLQKAALLDHDAVATLLARFLLPAPNDKSPKTLIGLGANWSVLPEQIATAYAMLAQAPDATLVRTGMRQSALAGTAKALKESDVLAKTGTAPCQHARKAPGDGYVAVLYPASRPRYALLAQAHGVPGAEAARTASRMMAVLRNGR